MNLGPKFKRAVLASTDPSKLDHPAPPALEGEFTEGQEVVIEHGKVWITILHKTKEDTWAYSITDHRDAYMGKSGGLTLIPSRALSTRSDAGYEPPVVEPEFQARITREAHKREEEAKQELLLALEDVRGALDERVRRNPAFLQIAGKSIFRIRSELNRLIEKQRKAA